MRKTLLDQLASLRAERVEAVSSQVARAQQAAEQALARLAAEVEAQNKLEQMLHDVAHREAGLLQGGGLRAADLVQQAAWKIQAEGQRQRAAQATAQAKEAVLQAQQAAQQARAALAVAQAEARVAEEAAKRQRNRLMALHQAHIDEENEDRFAARRAIQPRE
ncbi:MAG: hypothetical protein RMJ98_02255 [Myxococcales bacterium]|nr:hypothetical protein [Polyangiaceae bacterium]MDW8248112.1 hypothetical protein [Myxococcales bacterium]